MKKIAVSKFIDAIIHNPTIVNECVAMVSIVPLQRNSAIGEQNVFCTVGLHRNSGSTAYESLSFIRQDEKITIDLSKVGISFFQAKERCEQFGQFKFTTTHKGEQVEVFVKAVWNRGEHLPASSPKLESIKALVDFVYGKSTESCVEFRQDDKTHFVLFKAESIPLKYLLKFHQAYTFDIHDTAINEEANDHVDGTERSLVLIDVTGKSIDTEIDAIALHVYGTDPSELINTAEHRVFSLLNHLLNVKRFSLTYIFTLKAKGKRNVKTNNSSGVSEKLQTDGGVN